MDHTKTGDGLDLARGLLLSALALPHISKDDLAAIMIEFNSGSVPLGPSPRPVSLMYSRPLGFSAFISNYSNYSLCFCSASANRPAFCSLRSFKR